MNIRDFVGPALLALGVTLLFRSFLSEDAVLISDTNFVAPLSKMEQEPLYLDADFDDREVAVKEELTVVSTKNSVFTFSNHGATLFHLSFIRSLEGNTQEFEIIGENSRLERQTQAFLVLLDVKTPYYYSLQGVTEDEAEIRVKYHAQNEIASIEKTFVLHKETNAMDVSLTVKPRTIQEIRARMVWPSPSLQEASGVIGDEFCGAVSINKTGSFVKTVSTKLKEREGFFAPELFGAEDKYFVYAMVGDKNHFATRAYYKVSNKLLVSFLEAKPVTEETTWTVSYYLGPKEIEALNAVDARLEKTLDYGFMSPLTKLMLTLLKVCRDYVHNFGWAIILITLLIKLILLPFTLGSTQKMKKMQEYQKKLAYINQKYKHDSEALAQARQELIEKHGMPGLGGCLPLLIQIPIFWGLYGALNNSIELYHAPFIFWIQDLSVPDQYYVLPILAVISIVLSSLGMGKEMDFKQVFMSLAMALLVGACVANVASALVLYIFVNAFLHLVQLLVQKAFDL